MVAYLLRMNYGDSNTALLNKENYFWFSFCFHLKKKSFIHVLALFRSAPVLQISDSSCSCPRGKRLEFRGSRWTCAGFQEQWPNCLECAVKPSVLHPHESWKIVLRGIFSLNTKTNHLSHRHAELPSAQERSLLPKEMQTKRLCVLNKFIYIKSIYPLKQNKHLSLGFLVEHRIQSD